jgi:hypothetical protein
VTIHEQLAPLIRAQGIRPVARATGIPVGALWEWLHGRRNRRMGDTQLDALARAVGVKIILQPEED